MKQIIIGSGVFPDVASGNGLSWVIARMGDPRVPGRVAIFLWQVNNLPGIREVASFDVLGGTPAFPRIYFDFRSQLWFAYHDGTMGILRNASTSETIALNPCENNDPICFGSNFVAWQGAASAGWPITRMDLGSRVRTQAGFGAGTGLSRVLENGEVVLVDTDRTSIPGGTRPCWAADLVTIEGFDGGTICRLTDEREITLWPGQAIFTPRCSYEYSRAIYAVSAWADGGEIRVVELTTNDFGIAPEPPDPPDPPEPKPPEPPEPKPPEPPPMAETIALSEPAYLNWRHGGGQSLEPPTNPADPDRRPFEHGRTEIGQDERCKLVRLSDGTYALQSPNERSWLSVQPDASLQERPVQAGTEPGPWERFTLESNVLTELPKDGESRPPVTFVVP